MIMEKPQRIKDNQKGHTQLPVRAANGFAANVPRNEASWLTDNWIPIAIERLWVRNHFDSKDSCIVTINPLPIPKITRPATMRGKDVNRPAKAVRSEPVMMHKLTPKVPHTDPNLSIKMPPAIGKMVLTMDTEAETTP